MTTRSDLDTYLDANLNTNGAAGITGAKIHTYLQSLLDGVYTKEEQDSFYNTFGEYLATVEANFNYDLAVLTAADGSSLHFDYAQTLSGGERTQALTNLGMASNVRSLVGAADYAAIRAQLDLEAGTDFYSMSAADAAFQPKDSDLTAIAALTTNSVGRGLLEKSSTAALRSYLEIIDDDNLSMSKAWSSYKTATWVGDAQVAYAQPKDADLTAIAALTTDAFGRGLLEKSSQSAVRSYLGLVLGTDIYSKSGADAAFQPLDTDLTAIAALATATFGRGILTKLDASAVQTYLSLVPGTDVQAYDADLAAIAALNTHPIGRELLTKSSALAIQAYVGVRKVLTADTTFYVRTDGSDSNDGSGDTSGTAFLTLQKAWDVVCGKYDLNGFVAKIKLGGGNYIATPNLLTKYGPLGGTIIIEGDTSTAGNVVLTSTTSGACLQFQHPCDVTLQGFDVTALTFGVAANGPAVQVRIGAGMRFGSCSHHMLASNFGRIIPGASYALTGNATAHFYSAQGGIIAPSTAYTITASGGTRTFSDCFCKIGEGGVFRSSVAITFSGTFSGVRFEVKDNGILNTFGSDPYTFFAGDSGYRQSAGGIIVGKTQGQYAFPATQNPSTDANTLDDYEEGTFTPAFSFATPGNQNIVYSARAGNYIKIGKLVVVNFIMDSSTFTFSTATGDALISGLPFTVGVEAHGTMYGAGFKINTTALGFWMVPYSNAGGTTARFRLTLADATGSSDSDLGVGSFTSGTNFRLRGTFVYIADA